VGTFRPVDPDDHEMHAESYFVPVAAAETINNARAEGRREPPPDLPETSSVERMGS